MDFSGHCWHQSAQHLPSPSLFHHHGHHRRPLIVIPPRFRTRRPDGSKRSGRSQALRVADEAQQDPVPRPCVEVLDLQGDGQALARRGCEAQTEGNISKSAQKAPLGGKANSDPRFERKRERREAEQNGLEETKRKEQFQVKHGQQSSRPTKQYQNARSPKNSSPPKHAAS